MLISRTITDSLIEIGIVNPIDEASPQDVAYGLRTLNRIIDSYNTQNLIVTYLEDITLPSPIAWSSAITIGNGKDIDYPAPLEPRSAFFRQGSTDYNLKQITSDRWADINYKFDVAIPSEYYIQKTNTNDLKIYFNCIPQSDLELHLMAKKPYTGINGNGNDYLPTDDIQWNYGFEKMLMLRLAVELCQSYEIQPSQILVSKIQEAESNVKTNNYQASILKTSSRYGRRTKSRGLYR